MYFHSQATKRSSMARSSLRSHWAVNFLASGKLINSPPVSFCSQHDSLDTVRLRQALGAGSYRAEAAGAVQKSGQRMGIQQHRHPHHYGTV